MNTNTEDDFHGPKVTPVSIQFSVNPVTGGNSTLVTVGMSGNATEETTVVLTYSAVNSGGSVSPSSVCNVPGSIIVYNGDSSGSVTIVTYAVTDNVTVTVTATANGTSVSASLVITP